MSGCCVCVYGVRQGHWLRCPLSTQTVLLLIGCLKDAFRRTAEQLHLIIVDNLEMKEEYVANVDTSRLEMEVIFDKVQKLEYLKWANMVV